jgi:hypothetical protein
MRGVAIILTVVAAWTGAAPVAVQTGKRDLSGGGRTRRAACDNCGRSSSQARSRR